MDWGNGLLINLFGIDLSSVGYELSRVGYKLARVISSILYAIWGMLAWIVDTLGTMFKSLAGVNTDGNAIDPAYTLLSESRGIESLFNNLVAVSTALLIFFTIVKIVQEQYKEKNGGNPYIIVFRMFKGMLMFFFVTAAVLVGLYASGVILTTLNKATGGGSLSVSGAIFQSMSIDANRKRNGPTGNGKDFDAGDEYYYRLSSNQNNMYTNTTDGYKYAMVTVASTDTPKDSTGGSLNAWSEDGEWVIQNDDGTRTRVSTMAITNELNETVGPIETLGGYGMTTHATVSPSIDLRYTPIYYKDIVYQSEVGVYKDTAIGPFTLGTLPGAVITIPEIKLGAFTIKYKKVSDSSVDIPVDKNPLKLSLNGGLTFDGTNAVGELTLDTFEDADIVRKLVYQLVLQWTLGFLSNLTISMLPVAGAGLVVGPVDVGFTLGSMFKSFLQPMLDEALADVKSYENDEVTIGNGDMLKLVDDAINVVSTGSWGDSITIRTLDFDLEGLKKLGADVIDQINKGLEDTLTSKNADLQAAIDKSVAKNMDAMQVVADWLAYSTYVNGLNNGLQSVLNSYGYHRWVVTMDSSLSEDVKNTKYAELEKKLVQDIFNIIKPSSSAVKKPTLFAPPTSNIMGEAKKDINDNKAVDKDKDINDNKEVKKDDPNVFTGKYTIPLPIIELKSGWQSGANAVESFTSADFDKYFTINLVDKDNKSLTSSDLLLQNGNSWTGDPSVYDAYNVKDDAAYNLPQWTVNSESDGEEPGANEAWWWIKNEILKENQAVAALNSLSLDNVLTSLSSQSVSGVENTAVSAGNYNYGTYHFVKLSDDGSTVIAESEPLQDWTRFKSAVKLPDTAKLAPLTGMTGSQIDEIMVSQTHEDIGTNTDTTTYIPLLCLVPSNDVSLANVAQVIGPMTYTSGNVVSHLYDLNKMNWVVAFAGGFVALGVFMNFTFGLIQRVLNLAVLYVMSPITIAFYPFDDGQKFQSAFVNPFYKQVISTYSIILSLNLFFVMFTPVRNVVVDTAGGGAVGLFMYVIATMSLLSMLPKVRDQITIILGADQINEKKLGEVFKDAGNQLGGDKWKKLGGAAAKTAGQLWDRHTRSAGAKTKKKLEALQAKKDKVGESGMTDKEKKRMGKFEKKLDKIKAKQRVQELDEKRARGEALTEAEQKEYAAEKAKLGPFARARAEKAAAAAKQEYDDLQEKAKGDGKSDEALEAAAKETGEDGKPTEAALKAQEALEARKKLKALGVTGPGDADGDVKALEADAKAVEGKDDEALKAEAKKTDKDGKPTEEALKAQKGLAARKKLKELDDAAEKAGKKAGDFADRKAMLEQERNSQQKDSALATLALNKGKEWEEKAAAGGGILKKAGRAVVGSFKQYGFMNDLGQAIFNPVTGVLADTAFGKARRWFQWSEQDKRLKQMTEAESEWRRAKLDAKEVQYKQSMMANQKLMDEAEHRNTAVTENAARLQADAQFDKLKKDASTAVDAMTDAELIAKGIEKYKKDNPNDNNVDENAKTYVEAAFEKGHEKDKEVLVKDIKEAEIMRRTGVKDKEEYISKLINGAEGFKIDDSFKQTAEKELEAQIKSVRDNPARVAEAQKAASAARLPLITDLFLDIHKRAGLGEDAKLSDDAIKQLNDSITKGVGMDQIIMDFCGKVGVDQVNNPTQYEDIKKAFDKAGKSEAGYSSEIRKMEDGLSLETRTLVQAAKIVECRSKAREYAFKDMGIDIDSPAFQAQFEAHRAYKDKNYKGGYQQQLAALEAKGLDPREFEHQRQALEKVYASNYEKSVSKLGSLRRIRNLDYSNRQIEREQAEFVNMLGKQAQNRIDYHQSVRMDTRVKTVVFTDTYRTKLALEGNYQKIAEVEDAAVKAALKGNVEALAATGLDKKTQDQYLKWAREDPDKLKQITELGDLYREFMGSVQGPTSGTGFAATRNAMASLFQLQETKRIAEFFNANAKADSDDEYRLRGRTTVAIPAIKQEMQSAAFEGFRKVLTNAGLGSPEKLIEDYNNGVPGAEAKVQGMVKKLQEYRDRWNADGRDKAFGAVQAYAKAFSTVFDAAADIRTANTLSDRTDYYRRQASNLNDKFYLQIKKVTGSTEDQGGR
jgi:hypothetical protein